MLKAELAPTTTLALSETAQAEARIRANLRQDLADRFKYVRPAIRAQKCPIDRNVVAPYRYQHTQSIARQKAELAWAELVCPSGKGR